VLLSLWRTVAQERRMAISGTVLDPTGSPVTATEVTLQGSGGAAKTASTDQAGIFRFERFRLRDTGHARNHDGFRSARRDHRARAPTYYDTATGRYLPIPRGSRLFGASAEHSNASGGGRFPKPRSSFTAIGFGSRYKLIIPLKRVYVANPKAVLTSFRLCNMVCVGNNFLKRRSETNSVKWSYCGCATHSGTNHRRRV
jgi:hypothetical protein